MWHARLGHCNHKIPSQVLKTCNIAVWGPIPVNVSNDTLYYISFLMLSPNTHEFS